MHYQKTKLTPKQLETLLKNGNPQKYDKIRIIFNETIEDEDGGEIPVIIEITEANTGYYGIRLWESYEFKDLTHNYLTDLTMELSYLDDDLQNGKYNKLGYDCIKSVRAWYYNDQTATDYEGKPVGNIKTCEELRTFFIENREDIKNATYGGYHVGIGSKCLKINGNFYNWKTVYEVYMGETQDYLVKLVLTLLNQ